MGITNGHAHFSCSGNGAPNGALNKCETAGGNGRWFRSHFINPKQIDGNKKSDYKVQSSGLFRLATNGMLSGDGQLSRLYIIIYTSHSSSTLSSSNINVFIHNA